MHSPSRAMWFTLLLLVPAAADDAARSPDFGKAFWDHWGDGQAELAGYGLTYPRYGHPRKGTAVTIFVTETFSNRLRVKADSGNHPAGDEFPVLKLNLVQDFPTGIYDYNLMTSTFVAVTGVNGRRAGDVTKVSFSSQEWCGHVWQQAAFDRNEVRLTLHSYFDGEADRNDRLPHPADGMSEDALFHWARGLAAPAVGPGESVRVPMLRSLAWCRLEHQPPQWQQAVLTRAAGAEEVQVPAGRFAAHVMTARIEGGASPSGRPSAGRTWTFHVEDQPPHRILRWQTSDGHEGTLLRSARLKYWEMNGPQFEQAVEKLGLTPAPARTP